MLAKQVYDSTQAVVDSTPPSVLLTHGEYTIQPMSTCSEEEVALVFCKVCQRGNPVLQGRPFEDLELLGKAMYRKCATLGMGQVTKHDGQIVGLGYCWDAAEGGVWANSGLEMPASLAAHAACGKACMDSLPNRGRKTLLIAFYGLVAPHPVRYYIIMGLASYALGMAMGFEDGFVFTIHPTLVGKGIFSDDTYNDESLNWAMNFTDVASEKSEVLEELKELGGSIKMQLTSLSYNLSDEFMKLSAITARTLTPEEVRDTIGVTAANHLKFLRSFGDAQIISRL